MINYDRIPPTIMESLQAWVDTGRPVGGFLSAVLCNDLMDAMCRADDNSRAALYEICCWLRNHAPANCHGSTRAVADWSNKKRGERARAAEAECPTK